jgi:type VI secretion system protein ImpK
VSLETNRHRLGQRLAAPPTPKTANDTTESDLPMTPQFSELVHPVISYALNLKDRLDAGESPDLEVEQRTLIERLRSNGEVRHLIDYTGDGTVFLGARYALACWIDELFIVHSAWADLWKERPFEVALYGSRDRAWKFWEQADIALRRPNSQRTQTAPGVDAVESFFLCIVLGFRGRYLENPAKVHEYFDEMRPLVTRTTIWPAPRDLGVKTNVEPLLGRAKLRRVIAVYGSVLLLVVLILLTLQRFL